MYKTQNAYKRQAAKWAHLAPGARLQLQAVQVIHTAYASVAAKQPQAAPILTATQAGSHASAGRLHAAHSK